MKIYAPANLFVLLLLNLTTSTLAIKGVSSVGNRNLQATFKVTKVGPKESKDGDPKGNTNDEEDNDFVDPQDVIIPEDEEEEDIVQPEVLEEDDEEVGVQPEVIEEDDEEADVQPEVLDPNEDNAPKADKKTNTKKCRKPKKAPKERQRRQRRQIRVLKEAKGGTKEAKAPKADKAPKGASTNEAGTDGEEEMYCLHAEFTAEQCSDLQDGALTLEDGSITGDMKIQIIHDISESPDTTLENMEDILMYETRAKYIGCDDDASTDDINEIRRRNLIFHNDDHDDEDTPTNNEEDTEDDVENTQTDTDEEDTTDADGEGSYPKVTAVDFTDMEIDEQGCGEEVNDTIEEGRACSLIRTNFEIQYMAEDDVTAEQEDEMYDLLTEIMQKQVDGGDFTDVGDVQSITLGSLSAGTTQVDGSSSKDGGGKNVGIPIGIALGALAIVVAIVGCYCCRRRRRAATAKANDSVTTGSDNDHNRK